MTLILSCITQDYAIQVSDRRLTRGGQLFDDQSNKAVFLYKRAAFGYTGPAYMDSQEKQRTDIWLAYLLHKAPPTLCKATQALETQAAQALKLLRIPKEYKRLALVSVGWVDMPGRRGLRAVMTQTSNFHDKNGRWTAHVSDTLSTVRRFLPSHARFRLFWAGTPMLRCEVQVLRGHLGNIIKHDNNPMRIALALGNTIRTVGKSDSRVGRNLMVVSIPRASIGRGHPWIGPGLGTPSQRDAMCINVPADSSSTVEFSPWLVGRGSISTLMVGRNVHSSRFPEVESDRRALDNFRSTLPKSEIDSGPGPIEDLRRMSAYRKGRGARAIFETDMVLEQGTLPFGPVRCARRPPDLSEDGYQLTFMDENGNWQSSVSLVGELPNDRCRVLVFTHPDTISAMKRDPNYVWIEDVADGDPRFCVPDTDPSRPYHMIVTGLELGLNPRAQQQ